MHSGCLSCPFMWMTGERFWLGPHNSGQWYSRIRSHVRYPVQPIKTEFDLAWGSSDGCRPRGLHQQSKIGLTMLRRQPLITVALQISKYMPSPNGTQTITKHTKQQQQRARQRIILRKSISQSLISTAPLYRTQSTISGFCNKAWTHRIHGLRLWGAGALGWRSIIRSEMEHDLRMGLEHRDDEAKTRRKVQDS